jgi:hypothetical protein
MTGNPNIQRGLELDMVRAEAERLQALRARFAQLFDRSQTAELIEIARFSSSKGISLDRLELSPAGLSISGAAQDWNDCRGLADFIAGLGIDPELQRDAAGVDEMVHFRIEGGRDDD